MYVSCIWIWQSRALNRFLAAVSRRFCVEINLEPARSDRQKRRVRWLFMPRRYRFDIVCLTVTVREEWRRQKAVLNFAHDIIFYPSPLAKRVDTAFVSIYYWPLDSVWNDIVSMQKSTINYCDFTTRTRPTPRGMREI